MIALFIALDVDVSVHTRNDANKIACVVLLVRQLF